jgi:hypothetical protein
MSKKIRRIRMDKMSRASLLYATIGYGGFGILSLLLCYNHLPYAIKQMIDSRIPIYMKDVSLIYLGGNILILGLGLLLLYKSFEHVDVLIRDIPFAKRFYEKELGRHKISSYVGDIGVIWEEVRTMPTLNVLKEEAAFVVDSGTLPLPESEISEGFVEKVKESYLRRVVASKIEDVYILNIGDKADEYYFATQRQGISDETGFVFFWITLTPHLGSISWACHSAFLKPVGWDDRRTAVSEKDPLRSFLLTQFNVALKDIRDAASSKADRKESRGSVLVIASRNQSEDEYQGVQP